MREGGRERGRERERGSIVTVKHFAISAPSAPPSELRVNEIDVHYVGLTWSPPPSLHHNGRIRKYIIYYIETNGTSIESVLTTQTSAYISNLQPNTLYFCSVAAVTLAIGPNSTLLNFTTEIERK